jgi:hypothetical protein
MKKAIWQIWSSVTAQHISFAEISFRRQAVETLIRHACTYARPFLLEANTIQKLLFSYPLKAILHFITIVLD